MYDIIRIFLSSFIASLGFGVLFNIKGNNLLLAGIGGSIGGTVYQIMIFFGASEIFSMFLGSISFSLYSEILARIYKTPVTTFLICALIPLVPGGGMYRTMLLVIQGKVEAALSMGLNTLSIAGVLVLGIMIVSTVIKAYYKTKQKGLKRHA